MPPSLARAAFWGENQPRWWQALLGKANAKAYAENQGDTVHRIPLFLPLEPRLKKCSPFPVPSSAFPFGCRDQNFGCRVSALGLPVSVNELRQKDSNPDSLFFSGV